MASSTEIANMALSHLNVSKEIANIESEQSQEAAACRRFYDPAIEATLRDFAWPFSIKFKTLALIEENPTTEWDFSYRYPVTCLKIIRVLSGSRNDSRESRVEYKIASDDAGLVIYCDQDDAVIEYVSKEDDPEKYPSDFTIALSYRLAAYIAPRLTKGDPFNLADKCWKLYLLELSKAQANSVNEEQVAYPVEAEIIRARE